MECLTVLRIQKSQHEIQDHREMNSEFVETLTNTLMQTSNEHFDTHQRKNEIYWSDNIWVKVSDDLQVKIKVDEE